MVTFGLHRTVDPSRCASIGFHIPARKFLWIQVGTCVGWFASQNFLQLSSFHDIVTGNLFRVDGDRGLVERLPRSVQVFFAHPRENFQLGHNFAGACESGPFCFG